MTRQVLSLVAAVSLVAGVEAPAQDRDPVTLAGPIGIPVGDRVRLSLGGMRVEGRVSASDPNGLTIVQENGVAYRASRESLDGLEVSRRRPRVSGALRGALIGAVVGGGMSAAFLVGQQEKPDGSCTDAYGTPQICATSAQVAEDTALGAAFGALIGALWPGQRWERVRVDRVRVSVAPAPGGGVAVRTAVRF